MVAAGELSDPGHDDLAVKKELVADHRVAGENDQAPAGVDLGGMGVGGVGGSDDLNPMVTYNLLGRITAYLVLLEQGLDEGGEALGRTLALPARRHRRDPTQVADELFGELGEVRDGRVVGHGGGRAACEGELSQGSPKARQVAISGSRGFVPDTFSFS